MPKLKRIFTIMVIMIVMTLCEGEITYASEIKGNKEINSSSGLIDVTGDNVFSLSYPLFIEYMDEDKINTIYYQEDEEFIYVVDNENNMYKITNPQYDNFKQEVLSRGIEVKSFKGLITEKDKANTYASIMKIVNMVLLALLVYFIISRIAKIIAANNQSKFNINRINPAAMNLNGGSNPIMNEVNTDKTFDDVAGLVEVKKDMKMLVDFLKNKNRYVEAGAEMPKGVILYGPPGTGKTLLAKAIAGEAGVGFISMSGSEFVEMYVGVGPKRVRELFAKAKKQAPCIIFIDEIDAIGGKRNSRDTNGEDRKTLNQILTEMDGFKATGDIIVIAATNRLEDLDPALTRPGRFTYKYCVPLPETPSERLEVINLYAQNKKFDETVSFDALSKETIGFSPAGIKELLNDAVIISVQDKKKYIDNRSIEKAMFKSLMSGHMKENQDERDEEELKLVAWHEAGHALIGRLFGKEISKVTILSSTSGAGGVTFSIPKKIHLLSKQNLEEQVVELYGGRMAEYMLYKDEDMVTTGASNDIEKATEIIKEIVSRYGMTKDYGLLNLEQLEVKNDIVIEKQVELSKKLEDKARELLTSNYDLLETIANELLTNETLYEEDLNRIMARTIDVDAKVLDDVVSE